MRTAVHKRRELYRILCLIIKKPIKICVYLVCERLTVGFQVSPRQRYCFMTHQCMLGSPGHLTKEVLSLRRGAILFCRWWRGAITASRAGLSELKLLLSSPAGRQNIEAKDESQRTGQQAGNGQVIIG